MSIFDAGNPLGIYMGDVPNRSRIKSMDPTPCKEDLCDCYCSLRTNLGQLGFIYRYLMMTLAKTLAKT